MPFPQYLQRNSQGSLFVDGVALESIASRFGTPVYVISTSAVRNQAAAVLRLASEYCGEGFPAYAYKANTVPEVCDLLYRQGIGAEVSSLLELRLAVSVGVHPSRIIFNGPGKSDEALGFAIRIGVGFINADSMFELQSVNRIAAERGQAVDVGLRVAPAAAQQLHGRRSRFGVDIEDGLALKCLREAAELECVRIRGIHFHLGTQIASAAPFTQAVAECVQLASQALDENLMDFSYLDIGGGFPSVPSTCRPEAEAYFNEQLKRDILESILEYSAEALVPFDSPSILLEPGRLLVGRAGLLLTRIVGETSHKAVAGFVLDCGQNMVSSNQTLKLFHDVAVVRAANDSRTVPANLFGSLCYESDVIALALPLPCLYVGDLLAVLDCGAYDMQLASTFIIARPATVVIDHKQATCVAQESASSAVVYE